jgi:broad specificity phosphatase PhoE
MMSKVKIFLARLAQTEANVRHVLSNNSRLSAIGKTQAIKIRDRLKTESFAAMISSSISACIETAKIIAEPHRLSVHPSGRQGFRS